MLLREWAQVEAAIAAAWPQSKPHTDDEVRIRHGLVPPDLQLDVALNAVATLVRAGRDFPPPLPVLVRQADEQSRPPLPSPGATLHLLSQAMSAYGPDREADALRWLAQQSPHAARLAVELGWRQFGMERTGDPDIGGAVRQRLQQTAGAVIRDLERERTNGHVRELVANRLRTLNGAPDRHGLRPAAERVADLLPAPDQRPAA
ncbi:MAG: hypothetical protein M0P31_13595 [Solirubrobacteraceae bacterium]|nr:hypothetical protein [Solirubrobacteraceae bacterium]